MAGVGWCKILLQPNLILVCSKLKEPSLYNIVFHNAKIFFCIEVSISEIETKNVFFSIQAGSHHEFSGPLMTFSVMIVGIILSYFIAL